MYFSELCVKTDGTERGLKCTTGSVAKFSGLYSKNKVSTREVRYIRQRYKIGRQKGESKKAGESIKTNKTVIVTKRWDVNCEER